MITKHINRLLVALPFAAALFSGCKKEFDSPPRHTPAVGEVITIAELKAMFTGAPVHFNGPRSVYATVNSDENDGNFYKNVYVQDSTGGLCLRLLNSGGLYIGDSIRIYLPGTVLSPYNGLMQLDSVDVDRNTVKQATLRHIEPLHLTIGQLDPVAHQSMLVRLDSVEFVAAEAVGSTWADAVNQQSVNHTLEDCAGNQVLVRTSGYANYASQALPQGKGSFLGVLGVFGSDLQLYARTVGEVALNGPRCPGQELPFFMKNFNDGQPNSNGWSQWSDNNIAWTTNTIGSNDGTPYGQCKNWNGSANIPGESWLISPAVDLTGQNAPTLSFITGCNYNGAALQVLVSTDYTGGAPSAATWT
ncbi:MAG TPA: DUF5689 domain-containing protein, partial [Flavobacteriales bacterium]|nr:DUF5689 domain-containing protein [Flavobacteriales bacterium]